MEDSGRSPSGRATHERSQVTQSPPAVSVPNAEQSILDFYGLRTRDTWERCIISLDSAEQLALHRYGARKDWGHPLAASCWTDEERGTLKLFVADYPNGRRIKVRHGRTVTITHGLTPYLEHQQLTASAIEARKAEKTDD